MTTTPARAMFLATSAIGLFAMPVEATAAASCESLKNLTLANTTITEAHAYAASTFTPQGPAWRAGANRQLKPVPADLCRVTGTIKPTSDSDIKFELWLPAPERWTGRYESVGNGGFAGAIRYDSMRRPLLGGTAVASTDDGHDSPGADWALGHPEKIADYAYRAVHVTAEAAKALTTAYYSQKPKHSYFVGCSKGGQEGIMSAQRYPDDFDGIVSLAPAVYFTRLFTEFAWNQKAMLSSVESYLTPEDLAKIADVVVAKCDAQDGVKDGIVGNPLTCSIKRDDIPLSPAKVDTYFRLIDGPRTSDGKEFYPGYSFGAEAGKRSGWLSDNIGTGFEQARSAAAQSTFARGFFANFIHNDPKWDFDQFDMDKDAKAALALAPLIDIENPDLRAFRARGGKLIHFNGWVDVEVNPRGSLKFYERVVAGPQAANAKTQDYYRFFLGAGVSHCGRGEGPNEFGQQGGDRPPAEDMVSALYQWVEKGTAPAQVIARKYADDDQDKEVLMTRPICMYPFVPKYKGSGSTDDAANFSCAAAN